MRIIIASDHAGYKLKKSLIEFLDKKYSVKDFGTDSEESVDYPDFGFSASEKVAQGEFDRGILICGTGIGMSIVANKVKGIRAALCNSVKIAKFSRQHNDANILVLPGRFMNKDLAIEIVKTWLNTGFNSGRHKRRIDKIEAYENKK